MPKKVVKLADLVQQPVLVDVSDEQQISLRPLTLLEMVKLFLESGETFLALYTATLVGTDDVDIKTLTPFLLSAPDVVAKVIAFASDEPDNWKTVETGMSGPVQLIALAGVLKALVPDPKKARELLSEVTALLQNLDKEAKKEVPVSTSPTPLAMVSNS